MDVTSYTLTLASLILLAGALSDRWGRRRVFLAGLGWFTVASVLCAAAPGIGWLIAARALQGIGGALMTPASLAIIEASFAPGDRTRAIGTGPASAGYRPRSPLSSAGGCLKPAAGARSS